MAFLALSAKWSYRPKPNKRVTRGNKKMREPPASGANVAFSVPRKRVQGVITLEHRIKQGQLWVFTPVALWHSHRFGAPLNEDGTGQGF
jgi:hypothetical protein